MKLSKATFWCQNSKRFKQRSGGDTIVETLIAMAIISLVLVIAYSSVVRSTQRIRDTQERIEALQLAKSQIEELRANDGLDTSTKDCFDSAGTPASMVVCDYDTHAQSSCIPSVSSYCYHVRVTSVADSHSTSSAYISTKYLVTVTWDRFGGGHNTTSLVYKLLARNTAYVPPTSPPATVGVTIAQIDVGNYHVCANSSAGGGYCWGKNDFGALGDGTNNNSHAPNQVNDAGVLAGKHIVGTSAGYNHTCVVDSSGKVYCWGYNSQGQLGNGASGTTNNPNPTAVVTSGPMNSKFIVKINGGDSHTCALSLDGDIFCWGGNNYGQLGDGSVTASFVPTKTVNPSGGSQNWIDVSAGYAHTCALTSNGTAYCWGFNGHGQLGNGNNTDSYLPVAVSTGLKFKQISAGDEHTCAVTVAETVYCWGYNNNGQVGNGTMLDTNKPVAVDTSGVLGGKSVTRVAAGYRHTCAIGDGDIYCWGNNDAGQLGNGETFVTHLSPVAVVNTGAMGGKSMADIATGRYSSCAVSSFVTGGSVYCWGKNDDGQLGDDKYPVDSNVPSLVTFP